MTRKPPIVVYLKSTPRSKQDHLPTEAVGQIPKFKPNPVQVAALWLGSRLTERDGAYRIDGTPVTLDQIMRETNRLLAAKGQEMITTSPNWIPR